MDDTPKRHAELVLLGRKLEAIFDIWHLLPERSYSGESASGALHERGEIRTEQIETSIRRARQIAGLDGRASDDKRVLPPAC